MEETDVYPSFHGAVCKHPLYGDLEHFLMVRVHTVFDGQVGFRPPLRAIFMLDNSGSMGQYHDLRRSTATKLDMAKDTILHMVSRHLRAEDEVAVVVCNETARTLVSLRQCCAGPDELAVLLKQHLDTVVAFGGSNLKAGVLEARLQALRTLVRVSDDEAAEKGRDVGGTPNARLFVLTDFGRNLGEDGLQLFSAANTRAPSEKSAKKYGVLDVVHAMAAAVPQKRSTETAPEPAFSSDSDEAALVGRPRADAADEEAFRTQSKEDAVSVAVTPADAKGVTPKFPIYTSFLFVGLHIESHRVSQDLERICDIVGCNAVTVTPGGPARERFDNAFESMVTPVAREMRLELHASPFTERVEQCCEHDGRVALLRGDGEFYRARSIFPSTPGAEVGSIYGGVVLFKMHPQQLSDIQKPAEGVTTTLAMRVETGSGHQRVVHYTVNLPCVFRKCHSKKVGDDPTLDFRDDFQTPSIRKAIALWHYTVFAKSLLRRTRSYGLEHEVMKFKAYFEETAKAVGDPDMEKEVALWDQLVEIKRDDLKKNKNKSCCVMQ